jgi:hypothetical protein
MALHYDLGKIKNHETLCWAPNPDPQRCERSWEGCNGHDCGHPLDPDYSSMVMSLLTNMLIWEMTPIGVCEITPENAATVFDRIRRKYVLDNGVEPSFFDLHVGRRSPLTIEHIRDHIGLRTNSSRKTDEEFEAEFGPSFLDELERSLNSTLEERLADLEKNQKQKGAETRYGVVAVRAAR